jgi:hypothetical protein
MPTLAEQIAATRAKMAAGAGASPEVPRKLTLAEQIAATRAKTSTTETSEIAAAARQARAAAKAAAEAREAAEAAKEERNARAAALQVADAELGLEAGEPAGTLAQKIAATRAKVAADARQVRRAAEAKAAEATPPPPKVGDDAPSADIIIPEEVQADVEAGRADAVAMWFASAPASVRFAPGYQTLRKQLIRSAEDARTRPSYTR